MGSECWENGNQRPEHQSFTLREFFEAILMVWSELPISKNTVDSLTAQRIKESEIYYQKNFRKFQAYQPDRQEQPRQLFKKASLLIPGNSSPQDCVEGELGR